MTSGRARTDRRPSASFRSAAATLRTIRDVVRFGVSRFQEAGLAFGHGNASALDEATYLVAHALHLAPEQITSFADARLTPAETRAALALLRRRVVERRPAAYLTREAWIGPHRFHVDERAIVPRSFVGHWLCGELGPWIPEPERIGRVLELCTGSGCLAVLAALALPSAHVTATDVSTDALALARRNVTDYGLADRIALIRSDLFAALPPRPYELIIANPPYVSAAAMRALPREYLHEPRIALAGGEDGLDLVRTILARAVEYLAPDGLLVVEVGHARDRVEAAFPRVAFMWLDIDAVDDAVFALTRAQLHALASPDRASPAPGRRRAARPVPAAKA